LTGKYLDGIPIGSRASLSGYEWLREHLTDKERNEKVRKLVEIADSLGCTMSQLAIAWCATNPHVSSVITGASAPGQIEQNMGALEVLPLLTPDVLQTIDDALQT